MWLHMNQNVQSGSNLHFVKDGMLNKSLFIDQLHVPNSAGSCHVHKAHLHRVHQKLRRI